LTFDRRRENGVIDINAEYVNIPYYVNTGFIVHSAVDDETLQSIFSEAAVMKKFKNENVLLLHGITIDQRLRYYSSLLI